MTALFASAESTSVSSVMKVLFTQSARLYLTFRSNSLFSASAINFSASAGVPFAPDWETESGLFVHEDVSASPRLTRRRAPVHTCPLRQVKFMLASTGCWLTGMRLRELRRIVTSGQKDGKGRNSMSLQEWTELVWE